MMKHSRLPEMARRAAGAAMLAALVAASFGCASSKRPAVRPLSVTALILDFELPDEFYEEGSASVEGWWFGRHTEFRDANDGMMFADLLSNAVRQDLDFVNVYDRLYLRRYFARKRDALKREFPQLAEPDIDALIAKISPLEYARELDADLLITGKLVRSKTFFQRFLQYWHSTVEVKYRMVDVNSGQEVWSDALSKTGRLDSKRRVMDKLTEKIVRTLEEDYFYAPRPVVPRAAPAPADAVQTPAGA